MAPVSPDALVDPSMVPPVLRELPSKEDERPRQPRDVWEALSPQVCQASRKAGTAGDVPLPSWPVLAEVEGPGHRHLPGELLLYSDPSISSKMLL